MFDLYRRSLVFGVKVVDMRWGVRDEATDDHMTTELCMKEIQNCQRLSMGPNFVVSAFKPIFLWMKLKASRSSWVKNTATAPSPPTSCRQSCR
jgi:hypothetical protein